MYRATRAFTALLLTWLLSGCLLLSPYHGQTISSRTEAIPFQAWTTLASGSLQVECMPTNRFGPSSSHGPWAQIDTLPISQDASLDLNKSRAYSASKAISLPESCWYLNQSNNWYYSSIRVLQPNYLNSPLFEFYTVDREGVKCTGESVGRSGTWVSWLTDACYKQYSNSSNALYWVTIRTQG